MALDDCVVIEVKPSNDKIETYECPMCGSDITKKNMKPCKKNIDGHSICSECHVKLASKYYEGGVGCLYCGDPKTKKEQEREYNVINVTVVPRATGGRGSTRGAAGHINPGERYRRGPNTIFCLDDNLCSILCLGFCVLFCIIGCLGTVYLMCNIFYFIGNAFIHWVNGEDHTHGESDMTMTRAVHGFLGFCVVAYITFQICLIIDVCSHKFCHPCYQKLIDKIYDSHICNLIHVCITCEALPTPEEDQRRSAGSVSPVDYDSD